MSYTGMCCSTRLYCPHRKQATLPRSAQTGCLQASLLQERMGSCRASTAAEQ